MNNMQETNQQSCCSTIVSYCEEEDDYEEVDMIDDAGCMQKHQTESDELINKTLNEFELQLSSIPANDKQSYLLACKYNPNWAMQNDRFRLQFLRTEVFNVELAVQRFLIYWDNRLSLYNDRPEDAYIQQKVSMLSQQDYESLRMGYVQNVIGHSRIMYINPANTPKQYNVDSVTRAIHYTIERKLQSSVIAQQRGMVNIVDFGTIRTFDRKLVNRVASTLNDGFPLRQTMTIVINAPPGTGRFVNLLKLFMKPKLRERFHVVSNDTKLFQLTGIASRKELYNLLNHQQWLEQLQKNDDAGKSNTSEGCKVIIDEGTICAAFEQHLKIKAPTGSCTSMSTSSSASSLSSVASGSSYNDNPVVSVCTIGSGSTYLIRKKEEQQQQKQAKVSKKKNFLTRYL